MSKKVYIKEIDLLNLKDSMAGNNVSHSSFVSEDKPPYELDEFEIDGEGGNNDFFHVNNINESTHADLDYINSISYTVETDEDGNEYYDGEVYDTDGHHLDFFSGDRDDVEYYFQDNLNVAEKIFKKDAMKRGNFYWIEDLQDEFISDMNVNINNVNDVIKAAKRLSKPNGASAFILIDGSMIYFHDHAQIQSVCDGMTISKFLELGNIRCGGGSCVTIELIQQPTFEQQQTLKNISSYANEVIVDFAKPSGGMYPERVHSVSYMSPDRNRVVNDIMYYFWEGIKPLSESKVPQELINKAIELRDKYGNDFEKHCDWVVIDMVNQNRWPKFCQKKQCAIEDAKWLRRAGASPVIVKLIGNITENLEAEVEASEVKLDSFKKNDTLAPKIWDGFDLNSRVRLKLLDIADDFWDFTNITWVKRKGIHITGSICNFNWSKYSDIDLHIIVDFSEIDERKDFVQEYFNGKKNEWNSDHSKLKIFGYPVELYVEDVDAETMSGGLYDLEDNNWIKKPSSDSIKSIGLDKYEIKNKSANIMTKIDDLYNKLDETDDDAKLREIGKESKKLLGKLKRMRRFGLARSGESDSLNIIYKVLRRSGYLDLLWDLGSELYDKLNSIDEIKDDKTVGIILEYLESNHNLPLYKYFEWTKNATDEDKARDLMQQCSDTAVKYLETKNACMCDDLSELRIEFRKNNDVIYDEDFVDAFARSIAKNGLLRDLDLFMRYRGDFYELPSWMTMEFNRIVKNEWCIHFCFDAYSIAREGFKWGTDDVERLALTGAGLKKPAEGYNFAFPIGERHIDRNTYGSINPVTREKGSQEAVIFQTSGVEVYHEGDEEKQVVFWGPNAKNFIPIKYDRDVGDWCIYGNKGQVLKSGSPSEILNWVLDNLPQYRKQIMVGKNGVNLKEEIVADGNADHNPFKKRWKHEREVLKNYIVNYGEIMTSKENGKEYKVLFDTMLSQRLGINYCICIQWNSMTMEPGNIIYVRAFDKFTRRRFKPQFDTRGFDNIGGTSDDVV